MSKKEVKAQPKIVEQPPAQPWFALWIEAGKQLYGSGSVVSAAAAGDAKNWLDGYLSGIKASDNALVQIHQKLVAEQPK